MTMKIVSFSVEGYKSFGIIDNGKIVDVGRIVGSNSLRENLNAIDALEKHAGKDADYYEADIDFLPVVPDPRKIICVGINYRSHVLETGREIPKYPFLFCRFAVSQVGHRAPMILPRLSDRFDYEGELAVVIKSNCRYVASRDAAAVIAGYSCYNDGSVRDFQKHSTQLTAGKNFVGTGAFGPWLAVGASTPKSLATRLNGQVVQEANIDDMIFGVGDLVEYISSITELEQGDVIVTGTTGGVGQYRNPPLWLKAGDLVEVEIDGIGTLVNRVEAE